MKKHGMGFSKAMELVRSRRHQAYPNPGFISQLQQFEKSIQGNAWLLQLIRRFKIVAWWTLMKFRQVSSAPCWPKKLIGFVLWRIFSCELLMVSTLPCPLANWNEWKRRIYISSVTTMNIFSRRISVNLTKPIPYPNQTENWLVWFSTLALNVNRYLDRTWVFFFFFLVSLPCRSILYITW